MRNKLLLMLLVVLLVAPISAHAQEYPVEQPIGTVWESEQMALTPDTSDSLWVSPNQIGLGGTAEALVGMTWYGFPYNIVGTAISKMINGSGTYNTCAQVIKMERNHVNQGGSGRVCGGIAPGNEIKADHRVWTDWRNAYWLTESWHEFARTGVYWAPILRVDANL